MRMKGFGLARRNLEGERVRGSRKGERESRKRDGGQKKEESKNDRER